MNSAKKPKKDSILVRICCYYVLALFAFGLAVPLLPRAVQHFTHPGVPPIGTAMMILFAFAMPIAMPRSEDETVRSRVGFAIFFTLVMSVIMLVARYEVMHPKAATPSASTPPRCT